MALLLASEILILGPCPWRGHHLITGRGVRPLRGRKKNQVLPLGVEGRNSFFLTASGLAIHPLEKLDRQKTLF